MEQHPTPAHTGNPAQRLTPQIPNTVDLPTWIDPNGLAYPEALEAIRAEAAAIEADFITEAKALCETLRRMAIVSNAAYVAANPAARANDAPDVPDAVIKAVSEATGIDRLESLEGWLTGWMGEAEMTEAHREAMFEQIGYLVDWDDDLRQACNTLVGSGAS